MAPSSAPPGTRIGTSPAPGRRDRSLLATRRFSAGSLIATFSNPLLALPDGPSMRTTCNYCLRVGGSSSLRACTACKAAVYCDATCQRAHWKTGVHKAECKMFARIRSTTGKDWLPTPVRAVAQVLLLLKTQDPAMITAFVDRQKGLEGNVDEFRKNAQDVWADYELQAMAAVVYAGLLQSKEVLNTAKEVLCRIQTNAFNRLDADTGTAGIFLDAVLAMINHSCVPNAFVGFDRRTAMLRAERNIEIGEEIEISYVDYTIPKAARQETLKLYHFQCACPRCRDNLDVYQVCKTLSTIALNRFSLQPNLSKLRDPPIDRSRISNSEVEMIYNKWHSLQATADYTKDALKIASLRWKLCKPLVDASMWAVEPLPSSILELASLCQTDDAKFAYALPLACLLATECEPVKLVAPFLPWRVKGVMMIAKLLGRIGELTATGEFAEVCPHKGLVKILSRSDQVSMCEAMLRLVVHYASMGASEDWDVLKEARELLQDIESLKGREKESYFLRTWAKDPQDPEGCEFFEVAVLKPVNELAALAVEIMDAELGDKQSLVRR
ncbi:hypothetical protein B0H66DRAFT_77985 [Apodospora peruviana]|uniref:Suppressor of anucleate metulae protein B n=1 Tax=Apodospora peruviana TaxID=516989 RepID=A0AAE0MFR2_9PEZI|nr:hypothetical protein B0H66DRAFT_77985 [Apodospora peruviana]